MNALTTILVIGAAQGLFLAILLAARKVNSSANRVLALAMTSFSIYQLEAVYYWNELYLETTLFIGISEPLIFIFGPILYLYALIVIRGGHDFRTSDLLHFLPALAVAFYYSPIYFGSPELKLEVLRNTMAGNEMLGQTVIDYLKHISGIIYTALSVRLLFKHSKKIRDTHSSIEHINLLWLRNINIGLGAVWTFAEVSFVLYQLGYRPGAGALNYTPICVAILVYAIGYLGLRQPEIFNVTKRAGNQPADAQIPQANPPQADESGRNAANPQIDPKPQLQDKALKPYRKSGLDAQRAQALVTRLTEFMLEHKTWRRNDLTLQELAVDLNLTPHNLTEVINTQLGKNFYDFVNSYRVEDVKQRLWNPAEDHLTILALAYDAGFNAKSTFNTIFKKHTGHTPSQYRRLRDEAMRRWRHKTQRNA